MKYFKHISFLILLIFIASCTEKVIKQSQIQPIKKGGKRKKGDMLIIDKRKSDLV